MHTSLDSNIFKSLINMFIYICTSKIKNRARKKRSVWHAWCNNHVAQHSSIVWLYTNGENIIVKYGLSHRERGGIRNTRLRRKPVQSLSPTLAIIVASCKFPASTRLSNRRVRPGLHQGSTVATKPPHCPQINALLMKRLRELVILRVIFRSRRYQNKSHGIHRVN